MITLTGTHTGVGGRPESGTVEVAAAVPAVDATPELVSVTRLPEVAVLDASGSWSLEVRASDDDGWMIEGLMPLRITLRLSSGTSWGEYVILAESGPVVDFAGLQPLAVGVDVTPVPVPGKPGPAGPSAYAVAVAEGFAGSEAEWLASLRGEDGADSQVPGPPTTLAIGTVTTLPAGSEATATIAGTPPLQSLSLGLPKGDTGDLTQAQADARYEHLGAVQAHEAKTDPHPQYLTEAEGDARFVNVTGDTVTGALLLAGTSPRLQIDGVGSPGLEILRSAVRRFMLFTSDGDWFRFRQYDTAGVQNREPVAFQGTTGKLDLSGSASVTIPAPTAALQAAQVTAIDASTGRLAIGGHEIGDTGWRNLPLENGWTGTLRVRRVGSMIAMATIGIQRSAATADTFYTLPPGFRPTINVIGAAEDSGFNTGIVLLRSTGTCDIRRSKWTQAGTTVWFHATGATAETWPLTLPGAPA